LCPQKKKIGRRKVKTCVFWLSKNGFGPTFFHMMLRLVKGTAESPIPDVDWLDSLIGPGVWESQF
jgi:hypothetical protein